MKARRQDARPNRTLATASMTGIDRICSPHRRHAPSGLLHPGAPPALPPKRNHETGMKSARDGLVGTQLRWKNTSAGSTSCDPARPTPATDQRASSQFRGPQRSERTSPLRRLSNTRRSASSRCRRHPVDVRPRSVAAGPVVSGFVVSRAAIYWKKRSAVCRTRGGGRVVRPTSPGPMETNE